MSTAVMPRTGSPVPHGRRERSGSRAGATVLIREGSSPERVGLDPSDAQAGGRLTLEQRLDRVWEGLRAGWAPDCPVCQAELAPSGGAAGHCGGCGSIVR